jgi:hypothetical protein
MRAEILAVVAALVRALPVPLALFKFQEPTGSARMSEGQYQYALIDGNSSHPLPRVDDGVFGPYSLYFPRNFENNSVRLYASRDDAPALTKGIAGPNATVTMITWIKANATDGNISSIEGMVAGVWDEYAKARQYAIFTDLGACSTAPTYRGGLAAHISNCGGPTPGQRFCVTRACDPEYLQTDAWHCLANVYDGTNIIAYVNGSFAGNGGDNPYHYPGGIYSPEAAGQPGAEFGVGANYVNKTAGGPPVLSNTFRGRVGGIAVFAEPLSQTEVAQVCGWAQGFEGLAAR